MSGTSADGVDAALVEWPDGPEATPFRLVSFQETRFPPALQQRIHRLAAAEAAGLGFDAIDAARVDSCLDSGGSWDYEANRCDFDNSHDRGRP